MSQETAAQMALSHGAEFPFDQVRVPENALPSPPSDVAVTIARGMFADLTDRRGIRQELDACDDAACLSLFRLSVEVIRQVPATLGGAEQAITAIWAILSDVGQVGRQIENFDPDIQLEIRQALTEIFMEGHRQSPAVAGG